MRVNAFIAATVLALSVSACGTSQYAEDPLYDAGFADGCETATARTPGTPASSPVRDESMWNESRAYQAGWRAGYNACTAGGAGDIPGRDRY
jgi:hypothetical protein